MSKIRGKKRHETVWKIARVLIMPYIKKRFNYSFDTINPTNKNYIVLSNHVTDWDPIFVGLSFKKQMYYVASEHIFRLGFLSRLLVFFLSPIARLKGTSELNTVKAMLRYLKYGENVCIFPEGVCSFDGITQPIASAIGKLIKKSGAGMITYNIRGGYLAKPRWAKNFRKGEITGKFVREYTSEELSVMTEDEINNAVKTDLDVNAYDESSLNLAAPFAEDAAENIEYALYACPECGSFSSLKSVGSDFFCRECGLKLKVTPECCLAHENGEAYKYGKIYEWNAWQRGFVKDYCLRALKENRSEPLFKDREHELYEYERGQKSRLIGEGELMLYTKRLDFRINAGGLISFPIKDMSGLDIHSKSTLVFTFQNKNYEIKTQKIRSSLKYEDAFKILKAEMRSKSF